MKQHAWNLDLEETQVSFQLIDYGVQVFAWAGTGPNLQSLFVAVPAAGGFPAVTSLLGATPSNSEASKFCGRISMSLSERKTNRRSCAVVRKVCTMIHYIRGMLTDSSALQVS